MSEAKGVTQVNGVTEYKYFAGGEWRSAEGNRLFDVHQPYDRALYARVAAGGRAEAKVAVDAAAKAFPAWSQTTPAERARLLQRLGPHRTRQPEGVPGRHLDQFPQRSAAIPVLNIGVHRTAIRRKRGTRI